MTSQADKPPRSSNAQILDPASVGVIVQLSDQRLRWFFVLPLVALFLFLNVFVAVTVWKLIAVDSSQLDQLLNMVQEHEAPAEVLTEYPRVVSAEVVMSLIGGTVVQTGAALFVVAQNLFPRRRRRKKESET